MNFEQVLGLLILGLGAYFVVCSVWSRDFLLYRLKAQRVARIFGEGFAHKFYLVLGMIFVVVGGFKVVSGV